MNTSFKRLALTLSLASAIVGAGCATHNTTVGTKIDDTVITAKVKAALLADPDVSGQKVTVDTINGVVHLSGVAGSAAMAARAADIARRTDGVQNVQNKVAVR